MMRRGRPKKENAKTAAESSRDYRRRKKCLVDSRCKAVVGTPWTKLGRAPRRGMWETIWTGTFDEYVAKPGGYCYLPMPGKSLARLFGDLDLWREEFQNRQSVVWDDDVAIYDGGANHEPIADENDMPTRNSDEDTHEARGKKGFDREWREPKKRRDVYKILWRGEDITLDDYDYRFRWRTGSRCMLQVPANRRVASGAKVDIVKKEIVFRNWTDALDDIVYNIDDWNERAVVSEWTRRVARGHVTGAYISHPLTQTTGWPFQWRPAPLFPYSKPRPYPKRKPKELVTAAEQESWDPEAPRTDWVALIGNMHRLRVLREAANITLRGGKSDSVRHISAAYKAQLIYVDAA